jgi:putative sterol carrier protein
VQVVVTGLPDGDASWHARLDDGVVVDVGAGAPAAPDVTLTLPAPIAQAVAGGSLTPSAAFMQGRLKTAGDPGLVLDVLAAVDARD